MFNDHKYKIGDIVLYNNNRYRIEEVHGYRKNPYMTYVPESVWKYKYDLVLDRESREGELTVVRGVDERAIKCLLAPQSNKAYFPNYRYDPTKSIADMYPVKSSLTALEELNKREFERIVASPIRIDVDNAIKANYSKEEFKKMINNTFGVSKFEYKKIIFNGPCTIILWKDGTKTIAKASDGEIFDPEKGVAICFMKRALGETEGKKVLRKANKDFYDEITKRAEKDLKEALTPMDDYLGGRIIFDDMAAFLSNTKLNTNAVVNIDQSTIDEVKKVEEEQQDDNLAIGSRCSTCKYYDRPMTADPCSYCISDDQYKKRKDTRNDKTRDIKRD